MDSWESDTINMLCCLKWGLPTCVLRILVLRTPPRRLEIPHALSYLLHDELANNEYRFRRSIP